MSFKRMWRIGGILAFHEEVSEFAKSILSHMRMRVQEYRIFTVLSPYANRKNLSLLYIGKYLTKHHTSLGSKVLEIMEWSKDPSQATVPVRDVRTR
jgi:hypothetical protein